MAKPILVINFCVDGMSVNKAKTKLSELYEFIGGSNINDEYHTFILPVKADSNIQVFYEKDFDEIHYEELKKIIEEKLKLK